MGDSYLFKKRASYDLISRIIQPYISTSEFFIHISNHGQAVGYHQNPDLIVVLQCRYQRNEKIQLPASGSWTRQPMLRHILTWCKEVFLGVFSTPQEALGIFTDMGRCSHADMSLAAHVRDSNPGACLHSPQQDVSWNGPYPKNWKVSLHPHTFHVLGAFARRTQVGCEAAISSATIVFAYLIIGNFPNIFLLFSFIMKCNCYWKRRNAVGSLANLLVLDAWWMWCFCQWTSLLASCCFLLNMLVCEMDVVRVRCVCKCCDLGMLLVCHSCRIWFDELLIPKQKKNHKELVGKST